MTRRPTLPLIGLLLALLLIAACGDGGSDDGTEAQPSPDVSTFENGDFGDIPLPPLAEPAGERSEREGVVTRSFFVRNRTPEEVLDFYDDHFTAEGVPVVDAPVPAGDVWRGTWLVDDRQLLVSATPAPTPDDDGAELVTQLSLELAPAGEGGHEVGTTAP